MFVYISNSRPIRETSLVRRSPTKVPKAQLPNQGSCIGKVNGDLNVRPTSKFNTWCSQPPKQPGPADIAYVMAIG